MRAGDALAIDYNESVFEPTAVSIPRRPRTIPGAAAASRRSRDVAPRDFALPTPVA